MCEEKILLYSGTIDSMVNNYTVNNSFSKTPQQKKFIQKVYNILIEVKKHLLL